MENRYKYNRDSNNIYSELTPALQTSLISLMLEIQLKAKVVAKIIDDKVPDEKYPIRDSKLIRTSQDKMAIGQGEKFQSKHYQLPTHIQPSKDYPGGFKSNRQ